MHHSWLARTALAQAGAICSPFKGLMSVMAMPNTSSKELLRKTATRKIHEADKKPTESVRLNYWTHPILNVHRTRHNCLAKGRSCFSSELRTQLDSELTSRAPPSSRPRSVCACHIPADCRVTKEFSMVQATQIGLRNDSDSARDGACASPDADVSQLVAAAR